MNWKVRFKNKLFWLAIIPALFLLAQQVLGLFGVEVDFTEIQEQVIGIVNTIFVLLGILGIVTDMTTSGVGDSKRAMTYTKPYKSDDDIAA